MVVRNNKKELINNSEESLFLRLWNIIEEDASETISKSYKSDKYGKRELARKYFLANFYLYVILDYVLLIDNYLNTSTITSCKIGHVEEKFKFSCVREQLNCLAVDYKIDYVSHLDEMMTKIGVIVNEDCSIDTDTGKKISCVGIGDMIIGDPNDDIAFIIGPCKDSLPEFKGSHASVDYDDSHR